ncbi:two-component system, cell cycle sensor histidine kinase and response regulator CckA [Pararobbsia alpina]|uniref:response regulator n=1 Tax=Pararobbsia alpina TaxID=621374 RepID=UPI0039A5318E
MLDHSETAESGDLRAFLAGGGEMGRLLREHDWSTSPLGLPETWPQSLKTALRIMLTSRQPIWIGWGPELTFFYNDPYKSIIGGKHPWALGRPTRQVWSEIWDDIGPMLATALEGIEGTYAEAKLLIMERNGYPEETYYTFSYSPVPDDDGSTGGMICANTDDTQRVLGERQLTLLRELATGAADARTWLQACETSVSALRTNPSDIPFALLYAGDTGQELELVATCGIERDHPAAPARLEGPHNRVWPYEALLGGGRDMVLVTDLSQRFKMALPSGPWSRPPTQAVLLSISPPGETARQIVLVLALNPWRLVDDGYQRFLSLVAGQVASAIGYAEAYDQERQRAEALAELDRAKTTFFSNISHEFRTPLTLMLGPLEELLNEPETQGSDPAQTRALVEVTHRNGLRLLKLVNALLDFSRIESGRIDMHRVPTDIGLFTAELASLFRSTIERAGLELVVDCPPGTRVVMVDTEMWEQVVLNLISNAFKFTLSGRIEVRVAPGDAADTVDVSVSDTGIGIPADELPRVFERFHRVAGAAGRSIEGSGIGLALVHELIRLHGGTIRATSEPGAGTTFVVSMPVAASTEHEGLTPATLAGASVDAHEFVVAAQRWLAANAPAGEDVFGSLDAHSVGETASDIVAARSDRMHAAVSATDRDQARARILVADDNADLRDYMRRILTAAGYTVAIASDGQAALELMTQFEPDIVLSDVMMPRLDGFGLLRALRAHPQLADTPVLLLSARAGEEAKVGGLEAGADDYLVKPFSAREMLARVASNLQLARLRRETERNLREDAHTLEMLNRVGTAVAAELDLGRAVQVVTDAATELTGAAFGAFFYNVLDQNGESYTLYTLSGVPREAFERFPMPRNTAVFAPTFTGESIVRSDDITRDERYGKNHPHKGMPAGHLPVRSYLAAPVISRTGEVVGGLFFGHPNVGVFDARAERLVVGIAAQAAAAIDNARLFGNAQNEIGKRAKAEVALRTLNETLEQRIAEALAERDRLWETSEDLLAIADFDGHLIRVSPSWIRTLGHEDKVLLNTHYLVFSHPEDVALVTSKLEELRERGQPVRFEGRMQVTDGTWRWIAWTLSVDQDRTRLHGVGRDVTADREARDALRHAEEALRVAQKMEAIGKLTGGVAHDFNNLLQVIGGNLQLLIKDVAGMDKPEQRVRNALAGVSRGAKLASQLLAFGRRQPLAPKVVNLGRFIRGLDDMLRRALGDGVEIETIVSGGLWNTLVDPFQVENALLNLAINARDAMQGHGRLTIEAGNAVLDDAYASINPEAAPGQYVMMAVTDTGSGIAADLVERVFEPFFTTKPEGQGTGLGLSMVYGFVRQSGGHVKLYSEVGHGTTVRLYLPRVRQEEDLVTDIDTGPVSGGTETVLVAEDDEDVRATVVDLLSELGYRVLKSKDAQSALAIIESGVPIDVLFTDVVMPGPMRSTELARKARERLPNIAVLFTSGYTDNAIVHAGRLDEGIELLSKPYSREAMARKIRHVLRNQQQRDVADAVLTSTGPGSGEPYRRFQNLRILLVEDDELVRAGTAEMLRLVEADITEAQDGASAMEALMNRPVDVLIVDVGLPDISGIDLAINARRHKPGLRVIFASGHEQEAIGGARATVADAIYLRKPYNIEDLLRALSDQ